VSQASAGKGDKRIPGSGYAEGHERIFGKKVSHGVIRKIAARRHGPEFIAWRVPNLVGVRFGRLLVLEHLGIGPGKTGRRWRTVCDCGVFKDICAGTLNDGSTQSCGSCVPHSPANKTHNLSKTSIYKIWTGMIQRCENPKGSGYERYGAIGISVCDRWHKFENFLEDMGPRPVGLTLDRRDNKMGYSPNNCRWATPLEQGRNRKTNLEIVFNGKTQCLTSWADEFGIKECTLTKRLRLGWSMDRALTTPVAVKFRNKLAYSPTEDGPADGGNGE
jgi:hypothetical protein